MKINFTDPAIDDLRRIGPDAAPGVLKKILLLEHNPTAGMPLGGERTGFRKLVTAQNTLRVIYRVVEGTGEVEICEVWSVGVRRDAAIHAEAIARLQADGQPHLATLSAIIERLGRLTSKTGQPATEPQEPVPDWLAERLIHTAGLRPESVAALDLERAVEAWASYLARSSA